jgi:CHAD domain-containing protein/CYTH domain-containing protein
MHLSDDVIDRSSEEAVRVFALALLADADAAARRLEGSGDPEALHDFRVGLRRARTALRAFRPWLEDGPGRKLEKKLKKYAKATNAQRDAEVQLAWLDTKRDLLAPRRQIIGLEYLEDWIRRHAEPPDPGQLVARYRKTSEKLTRRLGTYLGRVEPGDGSGNVGFGATLAALIGKQLDVVRDGVDAVKDALDQAGVHRARIEGKRLRYLLEPLRGNRHADARPAVKDLKRLQDVLGELHDTHVLAQEIEEALVDAEGERARRLHAAVYRGPEGNGVRRDPSSASPRPGLVAILRLVRERRDALFADLQREWQAGRLDALVAEVRALEAALEARAGGKLERERKYLLAAVPPRAQEAIPLEIDQGWLPGARLRERIRRVGDPGGERFWRGLKQGSGRARLDAEEETTREVFEALWPLTEGRRVSKRRRQVAEGGLVWEIDEFTDRPLVVAQVELPAGSPSVALPDWLRPLVQREVTDDPAYRNESLAMAHPPAYRPAPDDRRGSGERPGPSDLDGGADQP